MPTNHSNNSGRRSTTFFYQNPYVGFCAAADSCQGYCLLTVQLVITHSDEMGFLFLTQTEEYRKFFTEWQYRSTQYFNEVIN